jgi:dTDP-4-amino-4,6-dideoxygalactose transaminase
MNVPMNDLKIQYKRHKTEIDAALFKVIEDNAFILGGPVKDFEGAFADYLGKGACVGVSNGTDALKLALAAASVGVGDEVITVSNTFGATVEAICQVGARPVLVDVDPDYYTVDVARVRDALSAKTCALIPVHLYGQTADMDPLLEIAAENDLVVVEDAAQAHGATYKGKMAGTIGHFGCFSFYPGKNLGAYGDAGAATTSD